MKILFEMLSYPFLVRALIVGILVSLCAALLGTSLVLKRYSMIGDGLSHVGFAALACAYPFGFSPLYISIPVCIAAAFFLLQLKDSSRIKGDAATALMCSGALLLDPERPLTFRKLYTRTLPRVLLALFFWAAAYRLPELLCEGFSVGSVVRVLKDLLAFRHEPHLYYLHITLLLYAFLPLTRVFVRHATERERGMRWGCGLLWGFSIQPPARSGLLRCSTGSPHSG